MKSDTIRDLLALIAFVVSIVTAVDNLTVKGDLKSKVTKLEKTVEFNDKHMRYKVRRFAKEICGDKYPITIDDIKMGRELNNRYYYAPVTIVMNENVQWSFSIPRSTDAKHYPPEQSWGSKTKLVDFLNKTYYMSYKADECVSSATRSMYGVEEDESWGNQ